jgi:hypothetical protein
MHGLQGEEDVDTERADMSAYSKNVNDVSGESRGLWRMAQWGSWGVAQSCHRLTMNIHDHDHLLADKEEQEYHPLWGRPDVDAPFTL